jgi:hypothetical protein
MNKQSQEMSILCICPTFFKNNFVYIECEIDIREKEPTL